MEEYESTPAPRSNKSRAQVDTYSPERMERMKRILEMSADDGEPQYYSIAVDGMEVVKKTTDVDRFDVYMSFIDHTTKFVELKTYFGTSPNCNTFKLLLSSNAAAPLQGVPQLGAVEIGEKINDAVTRERMHNKIEGLEKDVSRLEQENEILRKKLKKYKKQEEEARASGKGESLELLKTGVELFGPVIAAKMGVPVAAPVNGLPQSEPPPPPPVEVEIERESSKVDQYFDAVKAGYSEEELERALRTMELYAQHPELRSEFEQVITNKFNNHE